VRRDAPAQAVVAGHELGRREAHGDAEGQPQGDVLKDELPPHEVVLAHAQRCAEGQHRGKGEAVVHAGLEVERVAHDAWDARVGDHARGEHGVGRREQCADEEGLRPSQVGQQVGGERYQAGGDRHREHELEQGDVPGPLEHLGLHLEAVPEEDDDQRDGRQRGDEASRRVEVEHSGTALPEGEARQHEKRGEREEAATGEAGDQRAADQEEPEDERDGAKLLRSRGGQCLDRSGERVHPQ